MFEALAAGLKETYHYYQSRKRSRPDNAAYYDKEHITSVVRSFKAIIDKAPTYQHPETSLSLFMSTQGIAKLHYGKEGPTIHTLIVRNEAMDEIVNYARAHYERNLIDSARVALLDFDKRVYSKGGDLHFLLKVGKIDFEELAEILEDDLVTAFYYHSSESGIPSKPTSKGAFVVSPTHDYSGSAAKGARSDACGFAL